MISFSFIDRKNLVSSSTRSTTRLATVRIDASEANPKNILLNVAKDQASDPAELILANKLFKKLYDSYHDYLKWSVQNSYLTESGLVYKLNALREKIRNEMSQTYTLITQSDDDDEIKLKHMYEFFSSTGLLLNQNHLLDEYLNETKSEQDNVFVSFKKRKLLDTFADSLRHVNRLYNQMYGYMTRKVPAHMPHFIDRRIMSRLQDKFRSQFDQTSSNRFRSKNDMQYAFAYYYYVMSEVEEFNASKLFDQELDLNANGQLDLSEIMILNLRMSTHSFSSSIDNDLNDMFNLSPELAGHLNRCSTDHNRTVLTKHMFLSCQDLVEFIRDGLWNSVSEKVGAKRNKYKYEALGDEGTKFVMISGDPLEIQVKLNNLIREPRKFVCLNDNIDYKLRTEAKRLKEIVSNFYTSLFPLKSSFELSSMTEEEKPAIQVEYSSPINSFQSNNRQHGGLSQQRLFFFLPILVGIVVFVLILLKRLLFKESIGRRFGRFASPHSIIIKKNPVRIASKGTSGIVRRTSSSSKKQRTPSKAFISKMSNNGSSSDTESHLLMNSSEDEDNSTSSSSSSGQKALSTVKNEVAGSIREGLTRKKKLIKKLNITTI